MNEKDWTVCRLWWNTCTGKKIDLKFWRWQTILIQYDTVWKRCHSGPEDSSLNCSHDTFLFIERSFVFEFSINDGKFRNWEFGFGRISNRININCSSGDLKNRSQHTLSNKNINILEVQEVWIHVRVVVCFSMWPWYKLAMGWVQGVNLSSLAGMGSKTSRHPDCRRSWL